MTPRAILLVPADDGPYHLAAAAADGVLIGSLCTLASDADGWRVSLTPPNGRRLCGHCEIVAECRWDEVARVETAWSPRQVRGD